MKPTAISHWTEASPEDFVHRIASDFVGQLEEAMEEDGINQAQLAVLLGVTEGRVSQVLNNPGNITLRNLVEYARALRMKVSVIAYDDNDPRNTKGPISPSVFLACWMMVGKPCDLFEVQDGRERAELTVSMLPFKPTADFDRPIWPDLRSLQVPPIVDSAMSSPSLQSVVGS